MNRQHKYHNRFRRLKPGQNEKGAAPEARPKSDREASVGRTKKNITTDDKNHYGVGNKVKVVMLSPMHFDCKAMA